QGGRHDDRGEPEQPGLGAAACCGLTERADTWAGGCPVAPSTRQPDRPAHQPPPPSSGPRCVGAAGACVWPLAWLRPPSLPFWPLPPGALVALSGGLMPLPLGSPVPSSGGTQSLTNLVRSVWM